MAMIKGNTTQPIKVIKGESGNFVIEKDTLSEYDASCDMYEMILAIYKNHRLGSIRRDI